VLLSPNYEQASFVTSASMAVLDFGLLEMSYDYCEKIVQFLENHAALQ